MIEALNNRVILKATDIGLNKLIINPEAMIYEVVSVGKDIKTISVGDNVVKAKLTGVKILVDNEEYIVCEEDNIFAKAEM